MRFIAMHKTNAANEAGIPPTPELMANMGRLIEEIMQKNIFRGGEGLAPSSRGVRLTFANGERTITPGPLVGNNELLSGFIIVRVGSIDDAIDWATRFAGIIGDAEFHIRPVAEPWDIGLMPKPPEVTTMRYMIEHKATVASEAGARLSRENEEAMVRLFEEMRNAGVMLLVETMRPSSTGRRLTLAGGTRTVVDGPFTESKELIAGYAIFELPTIDDVMPWAWRFAGVVGDVEMDIRPLYDAPVEAASNEPANVAAMRE
jgi:hypothetical protein